MSSKWEYKLVREVREDGYRHAIFSVAAPPDAGPGYIKGARLRVYREEVDVTGRPYENGVDASGTVKMVPPPGVSTMRPAVDSGVEGRSDANPQPVAVSTFPMPTCATSRACCGPRASLPS